MKERIKGAFTKKKIFNFLKMALFVVALSLILLSLLGTVAHATGLVDDTINVENLYSKYPLSNYQLDFYVDNSWSWLPWNWLDGIGKSVQYGLYCITNFVWTISLYLSNATGYVVQEAYKLDFINDMADSIGKSIQTLAGVTQNGFSSSGFYVGFLLLIILVVGLYVAYTGLIKRETSKALHAVINFVVVFVLSASFIAYAPDYIKKINEFSSDISTASLDLGTKIMLPNSDSEGKDSVDLIRDSLFSIQVEQPWLLLQFGNSNAEEIGTNRVEALVSASPEVEDGKTREEVVKTEIEDNDNNNLTIPQVVNRLGMVFFLLFFNLGITIFVFLLTGMMLFSQILFIIFAMFLPISFLLSMIPSYESMAKQAIVRVFNTIMTRAGITLIVTVAFSISSMFYNISTDYPFFMVAFLQIVCFAGIYMKLGDLMSMFSLNANDSQSMGRRIFRRPYLYLAHRAIDQHTTHEKEIIELRLQDTNGIENFVKNFAKSYYTWSNSKEAIEARTQAISGYLTKELQDLNVDTIRTDIPTSSTVTDVIVWHIEQSGTDTFSATYEVDQQIKEGEQTSNVKATYTVKVHVDADGDMVIIQNPTLAPAIEKSDYEPKTPEADASVDADTVNDATAFLETFFKLYPTATEKELAYYVSGNVIEPIGRDYLYSELVNPIFTKDGDNVKVKVAVKFLDNQTKATQVSQYELVLHKDSNWKIVG